MSDEIKINGDDNIIITDVHDSNIKITKILTKSYEYNDLLAQLKENQEIFESLPEDKTKIRLQISEKINELTNHIEQFKRDVIQLADTFDKLEINTGRLIEARKYFENGDIGEARALLNDDNEIIESEEKALWAKRDYYQKEIEPKLIEKAEERLIQALLNRSDYSNPNWFFDTCRYFKRSIESYLNKNNIFQYALFLQKHNQLKEAEKYYLQYLNNFSNQISSNEYAAILNNLAILHKTQNNFDEAFEKYEEALQIYRQLAETDTLIYQPFVAITLNNMALLHVDQKNFDIAVKEYEEALQIRRKFAKTNSQTYLNDVAKTLNNLAILHADQNNFNEALKKFEEALQIHSQLAETNPKAYLPDLAMTLNNLAILHKTQNNSDEALKKYEEALQIHSQLAVTNPLAYLPYVAATLVNFAGLHVAKGELEEALGKAENSTKIYRELTEENFQTYFPDLARNISNLSWFYQSKIPNREKSVEYAIEVMTILLPYIESVPFTQEFFAKARNVLRNWNLSDEEISQMIEDKRKENELN